MDRNSCKEMDTTRDTAHGNSRARPHACYLCKSSYLPNWSRRPLRNPRTALQREPTRRLGIVSYSGLCRAPTVAKLDLAANLNSSTLFHSRSDGTKCLEKKAAPVSWSGL